MMEKHRQGGAGGPEHNWTGKHCGVGWGGGLGGQAKVPNGVKDIVSKISIFHIYIYIGLIILF